MKYFWPTLFAVSALSFAVSFSLARSEEPLFVLPDSDTSSIGTETKADEIPFKIRCLESSAFRTFLKKADAKGLINGDDYQDQGLVMVFKTNANSLILTRASQDGKQVCIFGATNQYELDIGVALTQRRPPEDGEFKGTDPEDQY